MSEDNMPLSCGTLTDPVKVFTLRHGSGVHVGHFPSRSALRGNRKRLQTGGSVIKIDSRPLEDRQQQAVPEARGEARGGDLHQVRPLQGSQGSVSDEGRGRGGGVGVGCRSSLQFPGDLEPRKRVAAASVQAVAPHAPLEESKTGLAVGGGSNKRLH